MEDQEENHKPPPNPYDIFCFLYGKLNLLSIDNEDGDLQDPQGHIPITGRE